MLIKLRRNMYYWKYRTKFKIYFNTYNVTDMTDKASKSGGTYIFGLAGCLKRLIWSRTMRKAYLVKKKPYLVKKKPYLVIKLANGYVKGIGLALSNAKSLIWS